MPTTRRTQLLMEPDEFRRLRALARRNKTSMAELIRRAVRNAYLADPRAERQPIVEEILHTGPPTVSWEKARRQIEAGHARLP
jgi:Ribbon-helix-helix protein, copG family